METKTERFRQAAAIEFGHASLGDVRRTKRLVQMTERVLQHPSGTVHSVFDNLAELHGAYDFLQNAKIDPEALMEAAALATARRVKSVPYVVIPTDGVFLSVVDQELVKGTGRVGPATGRGRGDCGHAAIVLDPLGIPLGIASIEMWQRGEKLTRKMPRRLTKDKETQRWLNARDNSRSTLEQVCPSVVRHYVHDCEADAWPVLLDMFERREGEHTTVRARHNRRIADPKSSAKSKGKWTYIVKRAKRTAEEIAAEDNAQHLDDVLRSAPKLGSYTLEVTASPKRKARTARIEVFACTAPLRLKDIRTKQYTEVTLNVVLARETEGSVPAGETAIEWVLLTTHPVATMAQASVVIEVYKARWRIEQYFKMWKTGCTDVESNQLWAPDHRARWNIILAVVAATLLRWQLCALNAPDTPAEAEFTQDQIQAVRERQVTKVVPMEGPVTVWQMLAAIAYLGGWMGSLRIARSGRWTGTRKAAPGPSVIARGWRRVAEHIQNTRERYNPLAFSQGIASIATTHK